MKQKNSSESGKQSDSQVVVGATSRKLPFNKKTLKIVFMAACSVLITSVGIFSAMNIFVDKKDTSINEDQGPIENSMENQIRISSKAVESAETDEDKLVSMLFLAGDYRQNEQYDQAIAQYQQVLDRDSSNIQALGGMVLCYRAKQDAENTIKYAQQAVASIESSTDKDAESLEYYQMVIEKAKKSDFSLQKGRGRAS